MNTSESGRLAALLPAIGDKNHHFVLTHGRSGSNHLCNALNLHPEVVNYGEVLGQWTRLHLLYRGLKTFGLSWAAYMDLVYSSPTLFHLAQAYSAANHLARGKPANIKARSQVRSIGVKDFCFTLRDRSLLGYLAARGHIRLIYLHRRNLLDRYLSLRAMQATGRVKAERPVRDAVRLNIDVADLVAKLRIYRSEEAIASEIIGGMAADRVLHVDYERLFAPATRPAQFAAIWAHLGLRPVEVVSTHRKILGSRREELIVNYREVEAALRDSEFAEFLTEGVAA